MNHAERHRAETAPQHLSAADPLAARERGSEFSALLCAASCLLAVRDPFGQGIDAWSGENHLTAVHCHWVIFERRRGCGTKVTGNGLRLMILCTVPPTTRS